MSLDRELKVVVLNRSRRSHPSDYWISNENTDIQTKITKRAQIRFCYKKNKTQAITKNIDCRTKAWTDSQSNSNVSEWKCITSWRLQCMVVYNVDVNFDLQNLVLYHIETIETTSFLSFKSKVLLIHTNVTSPNFGDLA